MSNRFDDPSVREDIKTDPLELDAVDQRIRINELRTQVEALGMSEGGVSEECPPEVEAQFLKNVLAYESAGVIPPSPSSNGPVSCFRHRRNWTTRRSPRSSGR